MVQTYDELRVQTYKSRRLADQMTHISSDTANDDLFLASSLDCSTEVSVVPGIDLTIPADDGDIRVHLRYLCEEWSVGALVTRQLVILESFRQEPNKKQSYPDPCWW